MLNFSISVFWLIDTILLVGGLLLMLFGGDGSSGGDYIRIRVPSLKQILGAFMFVAGIFLAIGKYLF